MIRKIKNGLYTLMDETRIGVAKRVQNNKIDRERLWHIRLRHIGDKGLKELQN